MHILIKERLPWRRIVQQTNDDFDMELADFEPLSPVIPRSHFDFSSLRPSVPDSVDINQNEPMDHVDDAIQTAIDNVLVFNIIHDL